MMIGVNRIGRIGILAFALSASATFADTRESEKEAIAVSFAELDLSKPAGAEALYDRLQRAAAKVCGVHNQSSSLPFTATADRKACYQNALTRAVAQLDAPLVKAQHAG
ncbi:MAG: UrcA family protein [Pseudomonadales bacterium]|jgi:UrcA family protein|nr:UrcA family protein [Pseudomonadales bacterium]